MFREPLAVEGFYTTKRAVRFAARAAAVTLLVALSLAFALGFVAVVAFDLLLVSWGIL